MYRTSRRLVALAAAGACCLTLASCSDPSSPGAGGQSDSSEVKLNVWIMGEGGPTFTQLTKEFTDQTGVGVEVESIPWANVNDKLTTAVASGQGPDVVQVGISLLQTFDDAGVLTDLSELIADYPDLAAGNFPDGVSPKELDPEGRTMSIPWVSDVRVLFYRTDLLAAVGYDHAPANWNEMQTAAAKLAERGADQYGYTIPLWDNALILQYVWQQGGDIVAPDGSLDFQTPEFDAALDHYLAFFESGAAPSATDFDQVQGFVTGNSPMTVSGPYLAPSITDAGPDIADDWTVALLPAGSSSRTSLFAGSNLAVWNGTEHLNEAIQLIDFMTKPEIQLAWYEEMSELPASQAALDQLTAQGDPAVAVYVEQLADARVVPQVPGWDLIANELTQTLTAIVTGAAERGTAMEQFYAKAAEIQANYS